MADDSALHADSYFSDNFGVSNEVIRSVLAAALHNGGDFADLYFQHRSGVSLSFEDNIANRVSTSVDLGVGIRVVVGEQTGYAFTEELTLASMCAAAKTAATIAHLGQQAVPPDRTVQRHPNYYDVDYNWDDVGIETVLPTLVSLNEAAHSADSRVQRVLLHFSAGQGRVLIVDSEGRMTFDQKPMTRMGLNVVMEDGGVRQSNGHNLAARAGFDFYSEERRKTLVDTAIERTSILFEAQKPPAGELPVVLAAGSSGILLHEAIGHGMEADFNRKGISIFSDKVGQKVAEDFVSIVDDGTNYEQRGAINFDDEGNTSQKTYLVENGVLRGYLHDRLSAKHYDVPLTGNGRRQSFRHIPLPRMRSTYMCNGPHSKEEIFASVKKGIYCISFTNGQVNIGAGDYTFYVKNGYLIEDGKLTAPIKDINLIGNGPESLQRVSMVADDFKLDEGGWTCGKDGQSVPVSLGLPSILVSNITVGGSTT